MRALLTMSGQAHVAAICPPTPTRSAYQTVNERVAREVSLELLGHRPYWLLEGHVAPSGVGQ